MDPSKKNPASTKPPDDIDVRIEKLKEEANALSNGQMRSHVSADCAPEVQEQFWKHVIAFEHAPEVQPFELLVQSGLTMPSPEELEDAALTVKLWEVINGMALLGMYLECTDHLSDRELYARLRSDILREPTALTPDDSNAAWHVDLIGSGSEEDVLLYLKYYADEDDRRRWEEDWPDSPMPDVGQRPFDRDRHLPQSFLGRKL